MAAVMGRAGSILRLAGALVLCGAGGKVDLGAVADDVDVAVVEAIPGGVAGHILGVARRLQSPRIRDAALTCTTCINASLTKAQVLHAGGSRKLWFPTCLTHARMTWRHQEGLTQIHESMMSVTRLSCQLQQITALQWLQFLYSTSSSWIE